MVGHGGSSAGSYLADPTSPIPSHCVSVVVTSTLRVNVNLCKFFTGLHGYQQNVLQPNKFEHTAKNKKNNKKQQKSEFHSQKVSQP